MYVSEGILQFWVHDHFYAKICLTKRVIKKISCTSVEITEQYSSGRKKKLSTNFKYSIKNSNFEVVIFSCAWFSAFFQRCQIILAFLDETELCVIFSPSRKPVRIIKQGPNLCKISPFLLSKKRKKSAKKCQRASHARSVRRASHSPLTLLCRPFIEKNFWRKKKYLQKNKQKTE